jgi:hypothetical protein
MHRKYLRALGILFVPHVTQILRIEKRYIPNRFKNGARDYYDSDIK